MSLCRRRRLRLRRALAERLEDVAGSLEELWISYNQIASLDGIACCTKLRVLYMSNNQVRR